MNRAPMDDETFERWYGPWAPLSIVEITGLLRDFARTLWIVGGHAIEAFSCVERAHEEISTCSPVEEFLDHDASFLDAALRTVPELTASSELDTTASTRPYPICAVRISRCQPSGTASGP